MNLTEGSGIIFENGVCKVIGFIKSLSDTKLVFSYGFNVYNNSHVNDSLTITLDEDCKIREIEEDKMLFELLNRKYSEKFFSGEEEVAPTKDTIYHYLVKDRYMFSHLFDVLPGNYLMLVKGIADFIKVDETHRVHDVDARIKLINCVFHLCYHLYDSGYDVPKKSFEVKEGDSTPNDYDENKLVGLFLRNISIEVYKEEDIRSFFRILYRLSSLYNLDLEEELIKFYNSITNKNG